MSDMDIIKPVIAAAVGRRDASGPINTLPKAQEAIGKAMSEACRAVFQNLANDDALKEGAVWRIAKTLAWAGVELVTDAWNDDHPDRGEAHELKGLWAANERLRKEEERLRKELNLQAVENIERTDQLLEERWTGLKARVAELERERVSLQEGAKKSAEYIAKLEETLAMARRYVPQGDCDQITIRKANQLMERDGLVPSGLILLNPMSGQRAYLEAGCVRWLDQDAGYFFMRPDQNQGSQLVGVELAARPSAAEIEGLGRELEQELAELRKLQKFVPSGPAGAINLRKADVLLKQPFFLTTGLVITDTETGDRAILDMSAVRWMGSESFQDLMHPKWAPVTASQGTAPGTPNAGPAQKAMVADAAQDEPFPGEERVAVPRALIGAACCAIARKRDGTKVLAALRRYTTGDLSAAIEDPANPASPCQGHAAQQEREEGGAV